MGFRGGGGGVCQPSAACAQNTMNSSGGSKGVSTSLGTLMKFCLSHCGHMFQALLGRGQGDYKHIFQYAHWPAVKNGVARESGGHGFHSEHAGPASLRQEPSTLPW